MTWEFDYKPVTNEHPMKLVAWLGANLGRNLGLNYRVYDATEATEHSTFSSGSSALEDTPPRMVGRVSEAGAPLDLALRSGVTDASTQQHIPMLDFALETDSIIAELEKTELGKYLNKLGLPPMYIYSSGKSFHGYVPALVTPKTATRFLGAMLLLNGEHDTIVDSRWIGHRLLAGDMVLRWSAENKRYKHAPRYVGKVMPCEGEPSKFGPSGFQGKKSSIYGDF